MKFVFLLLRLHIHGSRLWTQITRTSIRGPSYIEIIPDVTKQYLSNFRPSKIARHVFYYGETASHDTNSDSLINKLVWRKLDTQRQIKKATMMYKSLNGLALRSKFTGRRSVTTYSLRDINGKLAMPLP